MKKLLLILLLLTLPALSHAEWWMADWDKVDGVPTGAGDVLGPASSTDNAIPRFDGITGGNIQNSGVTIDDSNNISIPGDITVTGSDVTIGVAGVKLTGDGDGAITFLGLGNGSDEDIILNLDDVSNTVGISSSTGVTSIDLTNITIPGGDIANTPAGTIAATDVQTAINELDTEKSPLASPTFTGTVTLPKVINSSSAVSCVAAVCTDVTTSYAIYITSTGTDVLTIADGTTAGQEKYISHKVDGGSVTITPTNFSAGTSVTLFNTGDDALLHWNGTKWDLLVTYGGIIDGAGGGGTVSALDTVYIDAAAMIPSTTNGALQGTKEYGTNDIDIDYFAFDAGATEERVQFKVKLPEDWNLGTIKAKFDWSSDTGSTAGDTVEWGIKAGALSNDDTIDTALGTAQVITDTLFANNGTDLQTTGATPAITIGGTPALGDIIVFEIYRNTDGTDDMAEDAWLYSVTLQYTKTGVVAAW